MKVVKKRDNFLATILATFILGMYEVTCEYKIKNP